jgi:hypothetical protein
MFEKLFGWERLPASSGNDENSIENETKGCNGTPTFAGGLFGTVMWVEFVVGFDGIDEHDTAMSDVASKNTEAIVRERQADQCV